MPLTIGKKAVTKAEDVTTLVDEAFDHEANMLIQRINLRRSTKESIRATLKAWIASNPHDFGGTKLGSFQTTFGYKDTAPKAWWKDFATREQCLQQLLYDASEGVVERRGRETQLANKVLAHNRTKDALNELRRAIGKYLWDNDSWAGWISHYSQQYTPIALLPDFMGSYNLANSYPKYARSGWEYADLEDADDADQALDYALYNVIAFGMNWVAQPLIDYSLRTKDRISLSYDKRDFTVAENVAILHDLKELFSPRLNSRAVPTWHATLVPHPYQGAKSPAQPKRWETDGVTRVDILLRDLKPIQDRWSTKERRVVYKGEIKWDQGRMGAGTRNEASPNTVTAEAHNMPIETGRSHTAARLFEMVSLLKPALPSVEDTKLFATRLSAMAFGIFAYWNGDYDKGGYPKSLTPIHTYHEVLDPAEDYLPNLYKSAFTYDDVEKWLGGH